MSFSELLKQCRKQQGMSQAELASKLGVTQQAVGKWESGKSSPDPTTVARSAEILSTTADFLLGLYRPVASSNTPEERFFGNYAESLIPVIGTVKAGYGALAFEEDYGQEYARVKDPSNYFYLVSTLPTTKWSSRAKTSTACTSRAAWWKPRRSGKIFDPKNPKAICRSCAWLSFLSIFPGGTPWNSL